MDKPKPFSQVCVSAFALVGVIALGAIFSNYSGEIQFKFGVEGIQLHLDGTPKQS